MVLPAVWVESGAVTAALVAGAVLITSEAALQALAARMGGTDNALGRLLPALERATLFAFSTLIVGSALAVPRIAAWPSHVLALATALLFTLIPAASIAALARLRKRDFSARRALPPMALDFVGWTIGWMLIALLRRTRWPERTR